MKSKVKNLISSLLWLQVSRLRRKHQPLTIIVAGSIGKTGTKTAIANILSKGLKVQWQAGNYNDIISVPLVFFGHKMPTIYNAFSWLKILILNEFQIYFRYNYEVVVVEAGSDRPGDLGLFKKYIEADYAVLTGIAAEHMENFSSIEEVAKEEMTIAEMAPLTLVNADEVDSKYLKYIKNNLTYGESGSYCSVTPGKLSGDDFKRPAIFKIQKGASYRARLPILGKQNLPAIAAAITIATKLNLSNEQIEEGIQDIKPVPGRMHLLKGVRGSWIIDDTYNASPEAVIAALDTLYEAKSDNKIAILGQMNELGDFSEEMHRGIGEHCDPKHLSLVVTIGEDAGKYTAAAAEKKGCKVVRCPSPYHAADVIKPLISEGTIVLAKGSQNNVFAEEAVKELLEDSGDVSKLVRQSSSWLKAKQTQFPIS